MPISITPAPRTFGSELGKGVGRGLADVSGVYLKEHMQERELKRLAEQAEKMMPKSFGEEFGAKPGSEAYERQAAAFYLAGQPDLGKIYADKAKDIRKEEEGIRKEEREQKEEEKIKTAEKKELEDVFTKLEEFIPVTGSQLVPGEGFEPAELLPLPSAIRENIKFNRGALQKRETFDQLGFWVTDKVYTHFNKGTVSNVKFNAIKNDLAPRSDLSERENKARINSLKKLLNLPSDTPKKTFDKITDSEIKKIEKIAKESGTKEVSISMRAPNGQIVPMSAKDAQEALRRNTGWEMQ